MGSNDLRGVFDIETPEKTYQLHFDMNKIREIEMDYKKETGVKKSFFVLLQEDLASGTVCITDLFRYLTYGLKIYHPAITDEEVGAIIQHTGLVKTSGLLIDAMRETFPDLFEAGEKLAKGGDGIDEAGDDTGKNSIPQTGSIG